MFGDATVRNTPEEKSIQTTLTLEIPVYESQNRDSVRLAETRHFSRWENFFLVPKHIKMAQNTQIHPGKVFWRLK